MLDIGQSLSSCQYTKIVKDSQTCKDRVNKCKKTKTVIPGTVSFHTSNSKVSKSKVEFHLNSQEGLPGKEDRDSEGR